MEALNNIAQVNITSNLVITVVKFDLGHIFLSDKIGAVENDDDSDGDDDEEEERQEEEEEKEEEEEQGDDKYCTNDFKLKNDSLLKVDDEDVIGLCNCCRCCC